MAALETPNPDRLRPPNPTGSSGRSVCGLKVVCQTVGLLATLVVAALRSGSCTELSFTIWLVSRSASDYHSGDEVPLYFSEREAFELPKAIKSPDALS
jgi:hypothetical protein